MCDPDCVRGIPRRRIVWAILGMGLAVIGAMPGAVLNAAETGPLSAGAATSNISPPLGAAVIGGFKPYSSTHIHDELHARCLVLDNGRKRLALVVCDLLGIHRVVSEEARRLIEESSGIPRGQVLISATHTHAAASALGSSSYQVETPLDDYQRFVAQRIADGVRRAVNLLRPAEIAFASVDVPEHVFNRRWHMQPGAIAANPFGEADLVKMNPPPGSPQLVEPAGPTDPTVSILAVREAEGEALGRPIALYASYSLHYVGGEERGHVSADYYGMYCAELSRLLEARDIDPPFVAMMSNGTSGDINNINFRKPRPAQSSYAQMRYVAHNLAGHTQRALENADYRRNVVLDSRHRDVEIASRRPTPAQHEWARKKLAEAPADRNDWDLSTIYADRTVKLAAVPEVVPAALQVLRIDGTAIGTMPNEVFCEIGLEFKERSQLQPAFLVSLAHGYYGYLPTPRQHDLGGYETWLGTNRLEREASVKMLNELVEMTAELAESPGKKP